MDPENPNCREDSAYPAAPDSEYGWEKILVRGSTLHMQKPQSRSSNCALSQHFGPEGTWTGGRKSAGSHMQKVAEASDGAIEIWGDGEQTRSFLFIDECLEGIERLMQSDFTGQ